MTIAADRKTTKERILDTAERIFAEEGFDACSIRTLTAEAGVNLASVHYHFGSKEGLVKAVWERRVAPVNRERIARLDAAEAAAAEGPLPPESVLEALIRPFLRMVQDPEHGDSTRRLLGRVFAEPSLRPIVFEVYAEFSRRFGEAFKRALPGLPAEDLCWKIQFALGAIDSINDLERLSHISSTLGCGLCRDEDEVVERLIAFVVAGMKAPAPAPAASGGPARTGPE